ncbi:MAG: hypothetical protein KGY45_02135, partial [Hadesarchaea archaeon]|nr:hypothetical protein [Hadesarchaea archaeon]
MLNMNEAGVAVIAVAVATVAVAGGAVGTPVAVDEMDVQPDSPLYGLEKAGESIKEATVAGGQGWEIARGEERTQEYEYMASKAKEVTNNHVNLLDEAGDRFGKAVEASDSAEGLQKAKEALDKHISVLENVRENVPDVAKPAISMAISRSAKGKAVVEDVASGELPEKLGDAEKNEIKNQMKEINEHAEKVQEQVRENIDENSSEAEIAETVQNIELGTARDLENKANEMADEGKGESIPSIVEEAQARINSATNAAVDNDGLERARKASQKHLAV